MLRRLPESFIGDPAVFLNRAGADGHAPIDVAVRFGSARVAEILAGHGAVFGPRQLEEARRRGHEALAAFIGSGLKQ